MFPFSFLSCCNHMRVRYWRVMISWVEIRSRGMDGSASAESVRGTEAKEGLDCEISARARVKRRSPRDSDSRGSRPRPPSPNRHRTLPPLSLFFPPNSPNMSLPILRHRAATRIATASRAYSSPSAPASAAKNSSSAAADYKLAHPKRQIPRLPTIDPPKWSASEAVSNIL